MERIKIKCYSMLKSWNRVFKLWPFKSRFMKTSFFGLLFMRVVRREIL